MNRVREILGVWYTCHSNKARFNQEQTISILSSEIIPADWIRQQSLASVASSSSGKGFTKDTSLPKSSYRRVVSSFQSPNDNRTCSSQRKILSLLLSTITRRSKERVVIHLYRSITGTAVRHRLSLHSCRLSPRARCRCSITSTKQMINRLKPGKCMMKTKSTYSSRNLVEEPRKKTALRSKR